MDEDWNGSIDTIEIYDENHQYPFGKEWGCTYCKDLLMRFNKLILTISIIYYLANIFLLYYVYSSKGGEGLGLYMSLLIFQGISLLLITILAGLKGRKWLNAEFGKGNKLMLLSYLVVPLITYIMIH